MKRLLYLLLLVLMPVLVACGGATDTDEPEPTPDPAILSDSEADVALIVTGATTISAERDATVFCEEADGTAIIRLTVVGGGDQMYLTVPADATGTINLVGADDSDTTNADSATVNYRNNVTNYGSGAGELTIEQVPSTAGEPFVATLIADLTADNDESITIQASLNADAGDSCTAA